jgi:hypothetical protein
MNGRELLEQQTMFELMDRPGVQEQLHTLNLMKDIVGTALDRESFQRWLNDKEDGEIVGLTNTGTSCPLNTYLKATLSQAGYEARVYPDKPSLNGDGACLSMWNPTITGRYDLFVYPDEISLVDIDVILDGFEIAPPAWASAFIVEVDQLANTPEIPDDINDREIPVTKADCEALLGRIPV